MAGHTRFQDPSEISETESRAERLALAVKNAGGAKRVSALADFGTTALYEWMKGGDFRISALRRLALICQVDPAWLAFGVTDPLAETAKRQERNENDKHVTIPRYNVQASAGYGALVNSEQIVEHLSFDRTWLETHVKRKPEQLLLIEARGDSMEPTIHDGDLLLVDISRQDISTSAVHVIDVEGELLVKRLARRLDGSVLVHSDNAHYPQETITKSDREQLRIIGQVVWQGGPVRS